VIGLLAIAASSLAISQEMVPIRIFGREMTGLRNLETVIRGTCDGRPASATITKAYWGVRGRLVLRSGRWVRDVPSTFLNGALLSSGLQSAGLGCDGRRLQLHALAIRADSHGDLIMDRQDAILDLRTGILTLTDLRTLSPAETREELN